MPAIVVDDIRTYRALAEMPRWTRRDHFAVKKATGEHCMTARRCRCGRMTIIQRLTSCPNRCGAVWFYVHSGCGQGHLKECPKRPEPAGPF